MIIWRYVNDFLGVEYEVYHNVLYFLLYLNCEKLYEVVVMLVDSCDMIVLIIMWWWLLIELWLMDCVDLNTW